jgi:hypothetical protein
MVINQSTNIQRRCNVDLWLCAHWVYIHSDVTDWMISLDMCYYYDVLQRKDPLDTACLRQALKLVYFIIDNLLFCLSVCLFVCLSVCVSDQSETFSVSPVTSRPISDVKYQQLTADWLPVFNQSASSTSRLP